MGKHVFLFLLFVFLTGSTISYAQKQKALESNERVTLAKNFVQLLVEQDFSVATINFDQTMKMALPSEKLKTVWMSLIMKSGAFKRQVDTRTESLLGYNSVFVNCKFAKSVLDIKVVFNQKNQIAGLFFIPAQSFDKYKTPSYINPALYREKSIVVGKGDWALPGTLTVPVSKGCLAAIVLVHGSGPHDQDESIGPNKPFKDLACGLATKGIAVLRYEKRTKRYANQLKSIRQGITVKEETIDDALAAVSLLREMDEIDNEKIFVLGHSLGGMLIPRIGMCDPNIAGFVIMAGNTKFLEDLILEQTSYVASLDGTVTAEEEAQINMLAKEVTKIKNLRPLDKNYSKASLLGVPVTYWLDLQGYNPAEAATTLIQPILILQGGRDYQVTVDNFKLWREALSSQKNVKLKLYPNLNHLFIEGKGKSEPSEYLVAGNVNEDVICNIANWIKSSCNKITE